LRFVIDSNEYIFAFGSLKEYKAYEFLQRLLEKAHLHTIRIPRTIYEEVKSNKVFFVANFIHLFWMAD